MSNIDKQALRETNSNPVKRIDIGIDEYTWLPIEKACPEGKYVLHSDYLALLDELEAKDSTISTQQQEIRTLLNALEQATEKRNYDIPGQKRLIGWRASDYTDETSDPELAKNWAAAIGVLPIFEGDVNTKLSAAGIGKGA